MKSTTSEKTRHLLFRADVGELLPEALLRGLRDEVVVCGWVRASGVLEDIELRAYDAARGTHGPARRVAGPVQLISLEGSVGLANGDVSVGLRAVLARETDRGMETIAGELVAARIVALEAVVTAFDDIALPRALDANAGVWILGEATSAPSTAKPSQPAAQARGASPATTPTTPAWSDAIAATTEPVREPAPRRPAVAGQSAAASQLVAIPPRPTRPTGTDDDLVLPEAGDVAEHFAFGTCEVIKSDGDRLHLRMPKDQRVKEIALEMLKVTLLPTAEGEPRRFKLERRL